MYCGLDKCSKFLLKTRTDVMVRLRRLRRTEALRNMFAMDVPSRDRFIWPVFLVEGEGRKEEIPSMPGQYRWSVDRLVQEFPQGV